MKTIFHHRFCALIATIISAVMFPCIADASVFRNFIHTYTNTITVGSVFVNSDRDVWAGTSDGLMQYDDLKRGFSMQMAIPEPLRAPIHMVYGMNNGSMAVVTKGMKKYIFNPQNYNVVEIDSEWLHNHGIDAPGPWDMKIISNPVAPALIEVYGRIYLYDPVSDKASFVKAIDEPVAGLSDDGENYHIISSKRVYTYNFVSKQLQSLTTGFDVFAPHVVKDTDGNVWLGDRNLYRYDAAMHKWTMLENNILATGLALSGHDIYIGTSASGIFHYLSDGRRMAILRNKPADKNSPISDHSSMIYVDSEDNLWVTYSKCGLSISSHHYDITKSRHIEDLRSCFLKDDIIAMSQAPDGSLIAGTDGTGLYRIDPESGKSSKYSASISDTIPDKVITAVFIDSKQRTWIGGYCSGLICFDGHRTTRFLDGTSPFSIVEDIDGNIFAGTSGNGLFRIKANLENTPEKIDLGNEIWVQQLLCKRSPVLLAATSSKIFSIDTRSLKVRDLLQADQMEGRFMVRNLQSFCHDSRSLLWSIGDESKDCLRIYDMANDSAYIISALSGVRFKSIIEDDNKNIWLAADNSIYNIVPQYDPVANSYVFRHYAYAATRAFRTATTTGVLQNLPTDGWFSAA